MGLNEKRKLAAMRSEDAVRYQKELNAAVGFDLKFTLDVDSFPEFPEVFEGYSGYQDSCGPGGLIKAFKDICSDSVGREAVKDRIKEVIFRNTSKSEADPGSKSMVLENSVLVVSMGYFGPYSTYLMNETDMQKKIESLL